MEAIEKSKPLPKHTKLDYYECYAKIVLEEMIPNQFVNMLIRDKPDLQNKQLNIGVEVTSSVNPKQKEAESLYVEYSSRCNENKKKAEKQIEKCGGKLDGGVLFGISDNDNFNRIFVCVKNKLKLISGYKYFAKQYLFVFSDIYASSDMREEALKVMSNICYQVSPTYEGIYVLVPGALYVFDLVKNITNEIAISDDVQTNQACDAREMVIKMENSRLD